jgi:hypothetical protein
MNVQIPKTHYIKHFSSLIYIVRYRDTQLTKYAIRCDVCRDVTIFTISLGVIVVNVVALAICVI